MEAKPRKKKKLGSYPFLSVTISITLALIVIGLFGAMILHMGRLSQLIQENVEIQVYLNKQIGSSEITKINRSIATKPYVLLRDGNPVIKLVTQEEAAEQFTKDIGEDFVGFLGDNPLRDLLVVNIHPSYQVTDSLRMIKKEIEAMRGVHEVAYMESLIESISNNLTKIGLVLLGFFVLLLGVVIILINNTIKLALFSQRFLIRSMQLVGATPGFIRAPFLKRSAMYGFVAGILSCTVLAVAIFYAYQKVEDLDQLQDKNNLVILFSSLVILGILVAYLSTYRAVRKYLKMSLDELY